MEREYIEKLKAKYTALINEPPFNGQMSHRLRPIFIAKWKKILEEENIKGGAWVDDLLKALGR